MKIIKVFTLRRNLSHSFRNKDFVNKNTFKNINSPSHRNRYSNLQRYFIFRNAKSSLSRREKETHELSKVRENGCPWYSYKRGRKKLAKSNFSKDSRVQNSTDVMEKLTIYVEPKKKKAPLNASPIQLHLQTRHLAKKKATSRSAIPEPHKETTRSARRVRVHLEMVGREGSPDHAPR